MTRRRPGRSRQGRRHRLPDLPSLAPDPSFHAASGANEVVLPCYFDQAPITSVSPPVPPDQLALRAFHAVAVLEPLPESFGLLFLPAACRAR